MVLGKLQVITMSNLLSTVHGVFTCVKNYETSTLITPELVVRVDQQESTVALEDIPAGGIKCISLTPTTPGYGFLYVRGSIGGVTRYSQPLQVFVSRTVIPAFDTPERRLALVIANVGFTDFMGVFGSYVPRLRDVDYMVVELEDGRIAVISKNEIIDGVEPAWKPRGTAFSITAEYQFSNLEALAGFLESIGGYVARLNFRTSANFYSLPADQRIDLMLPYVNWLGKWYTFATSMTVDKATATLRVRKVIRSLGLAPLAAVAYGAMILLAGAGIALALYALKNFLKDDGDANVIVPAVIATSNREIDITAEIAKAIIDALDPAVLIKPKEVIKQEIDAMAGRAKSDNQSLGNSLAPPKPREPSFAERVGDFALKAGAGVVAWELFKRIIAERGG
jgi:hypothetical protein